MCARSISFEQVKNKKACLKKTIELSAMLTPWPPAVTRAALPSSQYESDHGPTWSIMYFAILYYLIFKSPNLLINIYLKQYCF